MADDTDAPATAKSNTGVGSLTAREGEFLAKAWTCLKSGPPEIDYHKLADEMGMTNHRSAMNAWGVIKKKMQWPSSTTASTATPGTPASTTTKRKKTTAASAKDDNEDKVKQEQHDNGIDNGADSADQEDTPCKKSKTTRGGGGGGGGGGTPKTPRRKQPATRKLKTPAKVKQEADQDEGDKGGASEQAKMIKAETAEDADVEDDAV